MYMCMYMCACACTCACTNLSKTGQEWLQDDQPALLITSLSDFVYRNYQELPRTTKNYQKLSIFGRMQSSTPHLDSGRARRAEPRGDPDRHSRSRAPSVAPPRGERDGPGTHRGASPVQAEQHRARWPPARRIMLRQRADDCRRVHDGAPAANRLQ